MLSLSHFLALTVTPLTLSRSHFCFLFLSKRVPTENMSTIISNVSCIACLLLFLTHTACLTCFSFCFLARLCSLFLFFTSRKHFRNDIHHFTLQVNCSAHLSFSLVLVHNCLSLSPVFHTFFHRRTGGGCINHLDGGVLLDT